MSRIIYIGIDDTDNLNSVGTGRVARGMGAMIKEKGLGASMGVSRHQLLVHPSIRYTSHNSSKGMRIETDRDISDFFVPCIDYLKSCWQEESDPGLCICDESQITKELQDYGFSAEKDVLSKAQAYCLAHKHGIFLQELGGDGGGVIGALAAVGLRSTGNNGRMVEVSGIRDLKGLISVGDIKQRSGIVAVHTKEGGQLSDDVIIDSLDWIRPTLVNWQPVFIVTKVTDENGDERWVPAEKPHRATGEKK